MKLIPIVNEFGGRFPVAWGLPNKKDFATLKVFCEKVKNVTRDISPPSFLADVAPHFYDTFCPKF